LVEKVYVFMSAVDLW